MRTFEELGINEALRRAVAELGYERPMPIQELVIPHLLNGDNDVIALAQTGTGKTAAFGLPVIQRIDTSLHQPQALILSPTRELCLQIGSDLADYSKYISDLQVLPVYGGSSIESQIRTLRKGVQIVVATPGRLLDLIERNTISLERVHTVILDEADEMLNMGFIGDIDDILSNVPTERKMMLFSATMPSEIAKIARKYMHNPEEYVVGNRNEGAQNVKHLYYLVKAHDKYEALKRIADSNPNIYAIVFCRTKLDTQEIADKLISDGYNADALHGDLSQAQRDLVMKKFREHNLQILVATDVAARGLDVDNLTHVINYSLPDDPATYTHRSGRTGRAGKTGISIAILHLREKGRIKEIEKRIGKQFERKDVPSAQRIIEKQLYNLADRIEKVEVNDEQMDKFIQGVMKKLGWLDTEDLLKRVFSLEFNRLLDYYKNAKVLDVVSDVKPQKERNSISRSDKDKDRRVAENGYERVFVNLGKGDGFFAPNLIEMVNKNITGGAKIDIGRIDLLSAYSLFDVRKGDAHRVISALKNNDFYGKRMYLEIADPKKDYANLENNKGKGRRKSRGEDLRNRATRPAPSERHRTPSHKWNEDEFDERITSVSKKKSVKSHSESSNSGQGHFDKFIRKKR